VKTGIHTFYDSGFRINRLCEASGITYERDSSLRYAPFRMTDSGIFEMVRLKKQSQFAGGQIGVSSYMKGDNEEISAAWV